MAASSSRVTTYSPQDFLTDKEFLLLSEQFKQRQNTYTPPSTPPGSPSPFAPSAPALPPSEPGPWAFLQASSERYLTIFSNFSNQLVKSEFVKYAPSYFPSYLKDHFFTSMAPVAGTAAAFLTQMFIRTFDYDPKKGHNPRPFGENLSRTVKSMAHHAVMMKTMARILSTSGSSIAAVSGYFGIESWLAYAPIWLGVGAVSFIGTGVAMILLHKAIDRIGVYKGFSDLIDYVCGSTIAPPSKEDLQGNTQALQMTQNCLNIFMLLRNSGAI